MATTQVETVSSGADKAKLAAVAALVVAAIAGFYLLSKQGPIVQWLVLLVGLAAAAGTFLVSEPGKRFVSFAQAPGLRRRHQRQRANAILGALAWLPRSLPN